MRFIDRTSGPLLPATRAAIDKVDIGKLADTLVSSGLDEEAVLHTALRARVLHPEILEVPATVPDMWNSSSHEPVPVPDAVDLLPDGERDAIRAWCGSRFSR
ncbi:MAG: hypothetical protein KIT31_27295 [Deltaproteobacteria bacterium]|nr:hypothetical protein [Deltaproteobacteria bacterium]